MAICVVCNKKFKLFEKKHDEIDYSKKIHVLYCNTCHEKLKAKEEKRVLSIVNELVLKYLSNCDKYKKIAIYMLYDEKDLYSLFKDDLLFHIDKEITSMLSNVDRAIKNRQYQDLDKVLNYKNMIEIQIEFLDDLQKIKKLLKNKNTDSPYPKIIKSFYENIRDEEFQEKGKIANGEFVRISNKLKDNITVDTVLKEFINSPLNFEVDAENSMLILHKFDLSFRWDNINSKINHLKEIVELERFEDSLGESQNTTPLGDYTNLDGFQFEEFLERYFRALGYIAYQTKLSGDQGADLVIMKDGIKTAVQAKKYSGKVSNKAIQEVVAAKSYYNCEESMVVTTGEFTNSAIELAISNGVKLMDKNAIDRKLREMNNHGSSKLTSTRTISFDNDECKFSCPYCQSEIILPQNECPQRDEESIIQCSECGIDITMTFPSSEYICPNCLKQFDFLNKKHQHMQNCSK